MAEEELLERAE